MFHVPEQYRIKTGLLSSGEDDCNNGLFVIVFKNKIGKKIIIRCIASDGLGWEHVSISVGLKRCAVWEEMCHIKNIFWDDTDCVLQYHPPKKYYVNCHPTCLHLWRPFGFKMPIPPTVLIGPI